MDTQKNDIKINPRASTTQKISVLSPGIDDISAL